MQHARCAWISPRRVYVRIPPIVYVLACNRVESRGGLSVNNKGENNPRRTTSTREKTLPQRQNHGGKMLTRCTFLPSNSLKTELHTGPGPSRGHMTDWPTCYRTKKLKKNSQQWRSSQAAPPMQQQSQYLDSKSIQYIWYNKIAGRNTLKCLRLQIQFKVKHWVKNVFQGRPEFNKKATVEKWKYFQKNGNNNYC